MTVLLNQTGNPITREERIKINENWDRIITGLTALQQQINLLAGNKDVQAILDAIFKALEEVEKSKTMAEQALIKAEEAVKISDKSAENANKAAQDAYDKAEEAFKATQNADKATGDAKDATQKALNKIAELDSIKVEVENATENAKTAADAANEATNSANNAIMEANKNIQDAIRNMNNIINDSLTDNSDKVNGLITDSNKKIEDVIIDMDTNVSTALQNIQDAITESNRVTVENTQKLTDAINEMKLEVSQSIINANNKIDEAIDNANIATGNAIQATQDANKASNAIKGWGAAKPWDAADEYIKNNIVTFNGSTWQTLVPNTNSQPSETNSNWILLARKGIDGTGSVGSVNGIFPDSNGNVELDIKQGTVRKVNNKNPDNDGEVILVPEDIGAETPQGAQDKTDVLKEWIKEHGVGDYLTFKNEQDLLTLKESGTYAAWISGSNIPEGYYTIIASCIKEKDKYVSLLAISQNKAKVYSRTFYRSLDGDEVRKDTGWIQSSGSDSGGKMSPLPPTELPQSSSYPSGYSYFYIKTGDLYQVDWAKIVVGGTSPKNSVLVETWKEESAVVQKITAFSVFNNGTIVTDASSRVQRIVQRSAQSTVSSGALTYIWETAMQIYPVITSIPTRLNPSMESLITNERQHIVEDRSIYQVLKFTKVERISGGYNTNNFIRNINDGVDYSFNPIEVFEVDSTKGVSFDLEFRLRNINLSAVEFCMAMYENRLHADQNDLMMAYGAPIVQFYFPDSSKMMQFVSDKGDNTVTGVARFSTVHIEPYFSDFTSYVKFYMLVENYNSLGDMSIDTKLHMHGSGMSSV